MMNEKMTNNKGKIKPSVFLTHDGTTDSLAGWSRRIGVDVRLLWYRWKRGMSVDKILSKRTIREKRTLLTIDGEQKSLIEWCRISGAKPNTVRYRIAGGWTAKKAVFGDSIKGFRNVGGNVRKVRYHGNVDTFTGHCRLLGVDPAVIRYRMKSLNCSFEKAVDYDPVRYMVGDRSMASVAGENGVSYTTALFRVRSLGWSCYDAATTPLIPRSEVIRSQWDTRRRNNRIREIRNMGIVV